MEVQMKMKKLVMTLLLTLVLASGAWAAADFIKIGLMAPMTGSWASEGLEMKQVLELLAQKINTSGGLLGKNVEIIVEDDGGDPRTAALAAQRLATSGIVGVIGTYGSSITEATQTIYDEEGIIQIANGSTAVRLTEKGLKHFFRTCPRDDEQGRVAAQTIQNLGFKKVAILHDNTTYAKGLADETKGHLKANQINICFFDALTPGERDYSTILTMLKGKNPDFVFFTGYYPEAGLLLRQKRELNWKTPFMGGDATNHPDLIKIAGRDAAEGFRFVSAPLPKDLPFRQARIFVEDYLSNYGNKPNSIYALLAGDGFRVLTHAIEKTKSLEKKMLSDYLHHRLRSFRGLTGRITFNDKGDRIGDIYSNYKVVVNTTFVLQQ
jgi:branched-chain amino acid transport system substrate-binding protein